MNETSLLVAENAGRSAVATAPGPSRPGYKSIRLSVVLRDLLKLLHATIPGAIQLQEQILTDQDWLSGDAARLQKALLNLATTACPGMQQTGGLLMFVLELEDVDCDLVVEAESAQKFLRLTLTASQPLPWETLAHIFEPKPTSNRGLRIVHEIITEHGGSICAESAPGQGTTFTILLPRAASPVRHEAPRFAI